jgi:hypothetical protein
VSAFLRPNFFQNGVCSKAVSGSGVAGATAGALAGGVAVCCDGGVSEQPRPNAHPASNAITTARRIVSLRVFGGVSRAQSAFANLLQIALRDGLYSMVGPHRRIAVVCDLRCGKLSLRSWCWRLEQSANLRSYSSTPAISRTRCRNEARAQRENHLQRFKCDAALRR